MTAGQSASWHETGKRRRAPAALCVVLSSALGSLLFWIFGGEEGKSARAYIEGQLRSRRYALPEPGTTLFLRAFWIEPFPSTGKQQFGFLACCFFGKPSSGAKRKHTRLWGRRRLQERFDVSFPCLLVQFFLGVWLNGNKVKVVFLVTLQATESCVIV